MHAQRFEEEIVSHVAYVGVDALVSQGVKAHCDAYMPRLTDQVSRLLFALQLVHFLRARVTHRARRAR